MALVENTQYLGIRYWIVGVVLMLVFLVGGVAVYPPFVEVVLTWVFIFSPLWAPAVLFIMWWSWWRKYIRAAFITKQTPVLLELRIPRQITKTPRAMEEVFTALNFGPGESTFIARWWNGKVRPWLSFELVSIEGNVHMYVWAWQQYREFIESQFYAQYPDIEIDEVEDYASGVHFDPKTMSVWGTEFALGKPDAYPIKTYIDFELDQDAKKPEQIVDPIAGVFERLSSIGPGSMVWVQIIVRQNKGAKMRPLFGKGRTKWKDEAEAEIEKLYNEAKPKTKDLVTGEMTEGYPLLKPAQVNTIKALERSVEKPGFDAGIRAVYVTRSDSFNPNKIGTHVVGLWSNFASGHLNSFKPGDTWHVSMDYPWEDFMGIRDRSFSRRILDAYRRRSLFHPPYERPRFVLTTEELATIFHLPSEETKAPGVQRMGSTKGEPPVNLPV